MTRMTDKQFDEEIARIMRRFKKLVAARKGEATVTKVTVKSYRVRAHQVRSHERVLIHVKASTRRRRR